MLVRADGSTSPSNPKQKKVKLGISLHFGAAVVGTKQGVFLLLRFFFVCFVFFFILLLLMSRFLPHTLCCPSFVFLLFFSLYSLLHVCLFMCFVVLLFSILVVLGVLEGFGVWWEWEGRFK